MTKRMIDADALLGFAKKQLEISRYAIDSSDTNFKLKDTHKGCVIILESFIEKIQELATPTEPQESNFDADGWCWDFDKFKDYYSDNGFLIKTETGWTTIRSREQYRLCLKGVVAWRPLPTHAPEPQESNFDADGWCYDMDLLHSHENVLLYVINPDLKTKRATTGMRIDKDFYFARVSERDKAIAWRPLPTPPKDKL